MATIFSCCKLTQDLFIIPTPHPTPLKLSSNRCPTTVTPIHTAAYKHTSYCTFILSVPWNPAAGEWSGRLKAWDSWVNLCPTFISHCSSGSFLSLLHKLSMTCIPELNAVENKYNDTVSNSDAYPCKAKYICWLCCEGL